MTLPNLIQVQPVRPVPPDASAAVTDLLCAIAGLFLRAWVVMIAVGDLHHLVPAVPPIGYWTTFALLLGLGAVLGLARRSGWKWANR